MITAIALLLRKSMSIQLYNGTFGLAGSGIY